MATKPSKFQGIFQPDEESGEEAVVEKTPLQSIAPVTEPETTLEPPTVPGEIILEQESVPNRRTGRPATGKKSDPNYRQVTAYVRKELYRNVTDTLYDESRGRDDTKRKEFSELVDELLERWWRERNHQVT